MSETLIFPDWPTPPRIRACCATRRGGFSPPPWDSFNLSRNTGDAPETVDRNRALLRELARLPAEPAWLNQVHGNGVAKLPGALPAGVDAAWTEQAGVVCAVLTADCMPVLFCDRAGTRVAAAHAGWRGLAGGVLETTLDALNLPPEQTLAWLGPAIGSQAFEVGAEVREIFTQADPGADAAFVANRPGHFLADLYFLARRRLQQRGISAIYGGHWCTFRQADLFFSYRRDRVTGRMASLIWIEA
jgi:YfiH family protein